MQKLTAANRKFRLAGAVDGGECGVDVHSCPNEKGPLDGVARFLTQYQCGIRCAKCRPNYRVDSISKPHASRRGSGIYFEFLLRRAHSRRRVERRYWSGESLYSRTTCSNSVMVGTMGPIGSGLPQLGFPRRLAMKNAFHVRG